jgi:hypothetical protein
MAKLQKAIITKKIIRPYGGVSEPQVGMTGHIVHDDDTPANNTCVRFLATTLGYSYDPEYDDKDRKYIKIYVPNDNFEIVDPNAKKDTKSKVKAISKKKAAIQEEAGNKMKQPEIMFKSSNNWMVLPGHCCYSQKEMEDYVTTLDPSGGFLKLVDLAEPSKDQKPTDKKPDDIDRLEKPEILIKSKGSWKVLTTHDCKNQKEMEKYIQMVDPDGYVLKLVDLAKEKDFNQMKQPQLMYKSGDGWDTLIGHGCSNQKEMEEYIQTLDPNGFTFKLVDLAEIPNQSRKNRI